MIQQDGVWLKPRFSLLHVMGIVVAWFGISSLQHSFEVNIRTELELAAAYVPAMPAHPPTPLAQQQQSNKPKGRVFVCGYMSNGQRYFPDYQYMGEWDTKKYAVTTTGNDLLLIGAFGPCDVTEVKYILRDFFAGKVLYINGEPYGNVFWRDWTPAFKAQHLVIPKEWWEELHEQQRAGDDVFHPHISRVFQIGPYPLIQERDVTNSSEMTLDDVKHKVYNKQSLAVFYGTVSIAYKVDEIWQFLADHSKKPQNNGRYRAIAWISKNCVQHRIDAAQQLSQDVPIPVHNGGKCAVSSDYNPDNQPMPAEFHVDRVKRENNHLIFRNFKYVWSGSGMRKHCLMYCLTFRVCIDCSFFTLTHKIVSDCCPKQILLGDGEQ